MSYLLYYYFFKHNSYIRNNHNVYRDTRQCSWFTHCATRRKVDVSIPDVVFQIFIDVILSAALGP